MNDGSRLRILLTLIALIAGSSSASAAPPMKIQARMFLRATGQLDADILKGASKAKVGNLDYGVQAGEMLVDVALSDGEGQLVITVKQGKLTATQTWKVTVGADYALPTAHYPLLVTPNFCGGPLTITAKLGAVTETRTIDFKCSE